MSKSMSTDPQRLFPADPATRAIAESLYARVATLPIISPHGHVEASVIEENTPFTDPATLFVSPDHYVTRLIHANGASIDQLRAPASGPNTLNPREVWRTFCASWDLFDGTASGYWLREQFVGIFGITEAPSAENADRLYDVIDARLREPSFRPRELFTEFNIEVLATTDDPLADLEAHRKIAADPTFTGRVLPTFRPDAYLNPLNPAFAANIERLLDAAGDGGRDFAAYLKALENRRRFFVERGAVSADHGSRTPRTLRLEASEAAALFERVRSGHASVTEAEDFEAHMLYQMARMSVDDGLVMTMHPGSLRNHHTATFERFGADTGHDIPFAIDYASAVRPLLQDFGTAEGFHLVLFTMDETVFSRELAPLAGFYPSVFVGAPWWFLDAPDAMLRFRAAVTETAGFSRSSGFIDDTRAYCSIPARHDTSRRIEAAFLARLVAEHRVSEERAHEIIVDIVDSAPRRVFKL
ncbi:glucuronate isomerase [Micrococcales bacterium 31B]|nr:glucuronate isomerase [Micrococcales bacterium 31B]